MILYAVYFYVRFPVSYRDLEEIMAERGVDLDHATLEPMGREIRGRYCRRSASLEVSDWPLVANGRDLCQSKRQVDILVPSDGRKGKPFDFMLSERRDEAAATAFFVKAIGNNGWPDKVVIDKSGSNTAGLFNMNCLLVMCGWCWLITVRRTKYLNNIIEQDHRFIKKLTRPMQPFKSLKSASATLAGIEVAHMIRNGQFDQSEQSGFAQFAALAG